MPAESSCQFPPPFNFSGWSGRDVRMMAPWCKPLTIAPVSRSLEQLAADPTWRHGDKVVAIPSLIVPCCSHSGTTFLWRCMLYAFSPAVVCGQRNPLKPHNPQYAKLHEDWSTNKCGLKKYLLPGLTGNIQGHWDFRKEWFFYGGGAAQWLKGWDDYLGVELPLWCAACIPTTETARIQAHTRACTHTAADRRTYPHAFAWLPPQLLGD